MTIPEFLKSGKRRCDCINVILVYYKIIISQKKRIRLSKNNITNFIKMLNNKACEKIIYRADCDQCGKLHFVNYSLKKMIKNLKESNIEFHEKESEKKMKLEVKNDI